MKSLKLQNHAPYSQLGPPVLSYTAGFREKRTSAKCSDPVSWFCFLPPRCHVQYVHSYYLRPQDPGGTSPEYLAAALTSAAASPRRKHQRLGLSMLRGVASTIIQGKRNILKGLRKRDSN